MALSPLDRQKRPQAPVAQAPTAQPAASTDAPKVDTAPSAQPPTPQVPVPAAPRATSETRKEAHTTHAHSVGANLQQQAIAGKFSSSTPAFKDADKLDVQTDPAQLKHEANTAESLLRAEIAQAPPNALTNAFNAADEKGKDRLRYALADALAKPEVQHWVESDPKRHEDVRLLMRKMVAPDPSFKENERTNKTVDSFRDWKKYPYSTIIVPGFTPLDEKVVKPGVHPVGEERLQMAKAAFDKGEAPFIMVSGGNVYPRGTPVREALEMKQRLVEMGVPADRIIVDAQARHSTTNLRNCGRYMKKHGMENALITTRGGGVGPWDQEFYMRAPDLSTFHARSRRELGYEVGSLQDIGDGKAEIEFKPSDDVKRFNYRDPADP